MWGYSSFTSLSRYVIIDTDLLILSCLTNLFNAKSCLELD